MSSDNRVSIDPAVQGVDPETVHQVRLRSGALMPVAAYGTFHSDWAQAYMKEATLEAIRLGWRHLDTARAYENEAEVGQAIREAVAKGYIRSADDLYITGKLWNGHMNPKDVAPAVESTLRDLGIEKIDMYLNHWPWPNVHAPGCQGNARNPDAVPYIHEAFLETWAEIIKLKKAGKIADVGTSNHTEATMKLLLRDVPEDERPVANQMEMHPLFQQTALRTYFESEGIACMGYMAVGSPHRPARDRFKEHRDDMADPVIVRIAEELGVSAGRVCLNWAVQRQGKSGGFVAMTTKSVRMVDNLKAGCQDILSADHLLAIGGDGTETHPGIDANNRLIWGQVFLWPETDGDWRILWDDSQVFKTRAGYREFKAAYDAFQAVKDSTTTSGEQA
ncbi:MAG: aldo/keto reductase family protein [Planctomycetota bacterium]|jgi:diketogulonate reductase-like aldo/keto reductase